MLVIDINNYSTTKKCELLDETGNIKYWSQPDFSYKKRLHVYDSSDKELGYVQYKILSSQKGDELYIENKKVDIDNINIEKNGENSFVVKNGNKTIIVANKKDNLINVDIADDNEKYILLLYTLIKGE